MHTSNKQTPTQKHNNTNTHKSKLTDNNKTTATTTTTTTTCKQQIKPTLGYADTQRQQHNNSKLIKQNETHINSYIQHYKHNTHTNKPTQNTQTHT